MLFQSPDIGKTSKEIQIIGYSIPPPDKNIMKSVVSFEIFQHKIEPFLNPYINTVSS